MAFSISRERLSSPSYSSRSSSFTRLPRRDLKATAMEIAVAGLTAFGAGYWDGTKGIPQVGPIGLEALLGAGLAVAGAMGVGGDYAGTIAGAGGGMLSYWAGKQGVIFGQRSVARKAGVATPTRVEYAAMAQGGQVVAAGDPYQAASYQAAYQQAVQQNPYIRR